MTATTREARIKQLPHDPTKIVREICWKRDRGACVRCRHTLRPGFAELQHRKARGMGGTKVEWINQPANLIWLCSSCHRLVESAEREEGVLFGYVILGSELAENAELLYHHRWARLDDDGGVTYLPRVR